MPVPPTGGCCIDGFCGTFTEAECREEGGVYAGDDQDCVDCVEEECDLRWTDAGGGDLGTASNWDPAQVPRDDGDGCNNLTFNQPDEYAVSFGNRAANALFLRDGNVDFSGTRLALSGRPGAGRAGACFRPPPAWATARCCS